MVEADALGAGRASVPEGDELNRLQAHPTRRITSSKGNKATTVSRFFIFEPLRFGAPMETRP